MKKNSWCDDILDHYSVNYRVKKWFMPLFVLDGGYDPNDELMMLLIDNPAWYKNSTISQCISWLKGTYNLDIDPNVVHELLIDLIVRYTYVLNNLKNTSIELNNYVKKYYM